MSDRLEVWSSTRGFHVAPPGFRLADVNDEDLHLVHMDLLERLTLCRRRAFREEIINEGRGRLCERCADAAKVPIDGLRWKAT